MKRNSHKARRMAACPDEDRRCTATSERTGRRCRKWALRGEAFCPKHDQRSRHAWQALGPEDVGLVEPTVERDGATAAADPLRVEIDGVLFSPQRVSGWRQDASGRLLTASAWREAVGAGEIVWPPAEPRLRSLLDNPAPLRPDILQSVEIR